MAINFQYEKSQDRVVQAYHVILVDTRSLRCPSIKTKKFKTCTRTEKLKLFVKNQIKQRDIMDEKSKTSEKSLRLVIPGDAIDEVQNISDDIKVIVGPGLTREGSQVFSSRCGILRQKTNTKVAVFWVDCHSKRYVPARGENVIGVIVGKAGDSFRVSVTLN